MNIPLVEDNNSFDCCVRKYRRCILNVLHAIKPKYSLEIGSHLFQSSSVWSYWIENNMPGGKLITCDIAQWTPSIPPKHVEQVMVYPHIINIIDNHGGINIYYKDWAERISKESSVNLNFSEIWRAINKFDIRSLFDFAFVDGDHSRKSFLSDLEIAQKLTREDGYILIDDISDKNHDQWKIYEELKQSGNEFYNFSEWNPNPGMALIQNKDLKL